MSEIEVKIRDDKAMLYTPYNPEFVKRIKKFSDARWNSGEKCWTIDESNGLEAPSDIVVRGGITEMEKRLCC